MDAVLAVFPLVGQSPSSSRAELDAATLEACRRHEPQALERFILRYQGLVFGYLSRTLGRGPAVEDLAQEVFLRAYEALPRFDPNGSARLSTWLLTIASRLVLDTKKRKQLSLVDSEEAFTQAGHSTPESENERRELGEALEKAASQLPVEQRQVLVLAQVYDLSLAEVAQVLGIPENTVKTRLFRARERMRLLLGPGWES